MYAYWCELCGVLFWIHSDIVSKKDRMFLNRDYYGKKISCPCCASDRYTKTKSEEDVEDED